MLAIPTAGVAGLLTGNTPEEKAQKFAEYASEVTYSPRTQAGQNISESTARLLDELKIPPYIPALGPFRLIPKRSGLPTLAETTASATKAAEAVEAAKTPRLAPPAKPPFVPAESTTAPTEIPLRLTPPNEPLSALSKETIPVTPEGQGIVSAHKALEQKRLAQFEADKLAAGQKQFPITEEAAQIAEQAREMRRLKQQQADIMAANKTRETATANMAEAAKRQVENERIAQMARENQEAALRAQRIAPLAAVTPQPPVIPALSTNIEPTRLSPEQMYPPGVFGGATLPAEKVEEPAPVDEMGNVTGPAKSGMDWNDIMLKMGLHLMAGESPNALTNVGKAGLGVLAMNQAEAKAKSEAAYREALAKHYTMPSANVQELEWARKPENMKLIRDIAQAKADPK